MESSNQEFTDKKENKKEKGEERCSENFLMDKIGKWKEGAQKKKERELKEKAERSDEWAKAREYSRPFKALKEMPKEKRDNILRTLELWGVSDEIKKDSRLSSMEILDADRKGVVGRLHSRSEQLKPGFNLSWRQILTRILDDHAKIHYSASLGEEDMEYLVLQAFDNNNRYVRSQKGKAAPLPKKIPGRSLYAAKANLVLDIAGAVDDIFEMALSTEDKPAISAVFAIVKWIHVEGPDADLLAEPVEPKEEVEPDEE